MKFKIKEVQKEKNMFCKLESFFFFMLLFPQFFLLHFKDDF
jgi:hypothetical protein